MEPFPSAETVHKRYEELISRVEEWVEGREDVRAALVIGSRARTKDHSADRWADLDIVLVVTDPRPFIMQEGWVAEMGEPSLTFIEATGEGGQERRVLYKGGLDVDFAIFPVEALEQLLQENRAGAADNALGRGVRVLADKDQWVARLASQVKQPSMPSPPSEEEFANLVNDFWYHIPWTAKHIRRGELWWSMGCLNMYLKELLRRMAEWHAQVSQGREHDTWLRGRFLEEWADERVVRALPFVFAHYDEKDMWRALFATADLFRILMKETAERLGYDTDEDGISEALLIAQNLAAEDSNG